MSTPDVILDEAFIAQMRKAIGTAGFTDLQAKFVSGMHEAMQELDAARAAGDVAEMKRAAHALRGLSAQFGAARVSRLARAIQTGAGGIADFAPVHEDLKAAVAATEAALAGRS